MQTIFTYETSTWVMTTANETIRDLLCRIFFGKRVAFELMVHAIFKVFHSLLKMMNVTLSTNLPQSDTLLYKPM